MTLKSIADQIGHQLGVPSVPMTFEEVSAHFEDASEHFGSTFLATMLAADVPVSSDLTRALLGWEPTHETLLEDLQFGDYITQPLSQPWHGQGHQKAEQRGGRDHTTAAAASKGCPRICGTCSGIPLLPS